MKGNSKFVEELMAFCVCTACITILQGTLGLIFYPEDRFGYEALLTAPIFGALSVLCGVVTQSKKELSVRQVLFRRLIHLLLIEGMVFGLNYIAGATFSVVASVILALGIAVVFVMVYVILWLDDRRSAADFNERLKEYQATVVAEQEE